MLMKVNAIAKHFSLIIMAGLPLVGCSAVIEKPQIPSSATDAAPTATDINRNIAAAAVLQSSASPTDYRIGPEDLLEITLFNIPEASQT